MYTEVNKRQEGDQTCVRKRVIVLENGCDYRQRILVNVVVLRPLTNTIGGLVTYCTQIMPVTFVLLKVIPL